MLWTGLSGADEASVTAALNSAARDPYSSAGYSLVMVHVWSKDLTSVQTVINGLAPPVRVVTPGELVALMTTNIAGKHTFDFEAGLLGWAGTTSGKPSDRADWLDGALRLAGSDAGIADTVPNATFSRPVSLPLNATQLRFDTRAEGDGLLRVRLRRANGVFVTLADWNSLPAPNPLTPSLSPSGGEGVRRTGEGVVQGFNARMDSGNSLRDQSWHTLALDLMPYAGEDVTFHFEQNDGGSGVNHARYIDNIGVDKLGVADVIEPEADSYARDGAFASANFGSASVLSTSQDTDTQESYLRFVLTNVSGRVLEARLRLTPVAVTGGATNAIAVVPDNY